MDYRIPSQRRGGNTYTVTPTRRGWLCNCPARKHCWHQDSAAGLAGINAQIVDVPLYDALVMAARISGDWKRVTKYRRDQAKAKMQRKEAA